jgi:hypothetical protein
LQKLDLFTLGPKLVPSFDPKTEDGNSNPTPSSSELTFLLDPSDLEAVEITEESAQHDPMEPHYVTLKLKYVSVRIWHVTDASKTTAQESSQSAPLKALHKSLERILDEYKLRSHMDVLHAEQRDVTDPIVNQGETSEDDRKSDDKVNLITELYNLDGKRREWLRRVSSFLETALVLQKTGRLHVVRVCWSDFLA